MLKNEPMHLDDRRAIQFDINIELRHNLRDCSYRVGDYISHLEKLGKKNSIRVIYSASNDNELL